MIEKFETIYLLQSQERMSCGVENWQNSFTPIKTKVLKQNLNDLLQRRGDYFYEGIRLNATHTDTVDMST